MIGQKQGQETLNPIKPLGVTEQAINQSPPLPENSDSSEFPKKEKMITYKKVIIVVVLSILFTFFVTFTPTFIILKKKIAEKQQEYSNLEPLSSDGLDQNYEGNLLKSRLDFRMEVAATIFNQARGESKEGRQAVAAVIYNRQKFSCPRCGQNHGLGSWQSIKVFHGYSSKKPFVPRAQQSIWNECVELAKGPVTDNTGESTHFQKKSWGKGFENKVKIGNHYFAKQRTQQTRHQRRK